MIHDNAAFEKKPEKVVHKDLGKEFSGQEYGIKIDRISQKSLK
jgi:hypothetical protein